MAFYASGRRKPVLPTPLFTLSRPGITYGETGPNGKYLARVYDRYSAINIYHLSHRVHPWTKKLAGTQFVWSFRS